MRLNDWNPAGDREVESGCALLPIAAGLSGRVLSPRPDPSSTLARARIPPADPSRLVGILHGRTSSSPLSVLSPRILITALPRSPAIA